VGAQGLVAGNLHQLWVQLLSVLAAGIYAFVVTYLIGLILNKTMGLRVNDEEEFGGLDKEIHGEVGYSI
jgi:Amt family ammonium transporter